MSTLLGIAITTFNNCDLVSRQIKELRRLTRTGHTIIVADDGSEDETVKSLRASGTTVITGPNRGVAWNKNRGLFYLLNKTDCQTILLLDDDILPVATGWESDWIEVLTRFGHVNYMVPSFAAERVLAGQMTAASPGLSTSCFGPLIGCTREACSYVGYFDIRFGRWGFEHVDFTNRFMRAGYGGIPHNKTAHKRPLYLVLSSGVELTNRPSVLSIKEKEPLIENGRKILIGSQSEPIYRCPWSSEDQMRAFQLEMGGGASETIKREFDSSSMHQKKNIIADPEFVNAVSKAQHQLEDVNNRKLFFIHIPKTAGTTINNMVTEMLGKERALTHIESLPGFLTSLQSAPSSIKYISGHHRLPDILANIDRREWFIFLSLRNPVEHLISHLKWMKSLGAPGNELLLREHSAVIQEMASRLWETKLDDIAGIHKIINEEFTVAKQYFDNCQVRYLTTYCDRPVNYEAAAAAVEALSNVDYVGFSESVSDIRSVVARFINVQPDAYSVPRINRTPFAEDVNLSNPVIRDFYREAVRWDAFLYTEAQKKFR